MQKKKKFSSFLNKLWLNKTEMILQIAYFLVVFILLWTRRIRILVYIIFALFIVNIGLKGIKSHWDLKWWNYLVSIFLPSTFIFWIGFIYAGLYNTTLTAYFSWLLNQWWVLGLLIILAFGFKYIFFAFVHITKYIKSLFINREVQRIVIAFIAIYVFIIIVFALTYASIFVRNPSSFYAIKPVGITDFLYFSTAQAATLGYKEISPANQLTKFLALMETFLFTTTVALFLGNIFYSAKGNK